MGLDREERRCPSDSTDGLRQALDNVGKAVFSQSKGGKEP